MWKAYLENTWSGVHYRFKNLWPRGYDIVLVVDWMSDHNHIAFNYEKVSLYIIVDGKQMVILGIREEPTLKTIYVKALQKID